MRPRNLLGAVLGAALLGAGGAAWSAEPVKLTVAWVVPVSNLATMFLSKPEILRHQGKSYVFEPVNYAGTPLMITALATGDLQVGLLGYTSLPLAVQNAGLQDLRVIADEIRDGVPGHYSHEFMVRADSGITKVADLKGKVLATNAVGSAVDIAMRAALRKAGLDDKRDVSVIEVGFPNMKAILADRKADLVTAVNPFAQDPELRAMSRTLFTEADGLGPNELGIFAARAGFIAQHRAALVDFLEDFLRVTRFYTNPANRDEALRIAAQVSKRPAASFASWLYTERDYYRDPNGIPDLAALQSNVDTMRDLGLLKASIDVKRYVDLSLVQEAAKRLK